MYWLKYTFAPCVGWNRDGSMSDFTAQEDFTSPRSNIEPDADYTRSSETGQDGYFRRPETVDYSDSANSGGVNHECEERMRFLVSRSEMCFQELSNFVQRDLGSMDERVHLNYTRIVQRTRANEQRSELPVTIFFNGRNLAVITRLANGKRPF